LLPERPINQRWGLTLYRAVAALEYMATGIYRVVNEGL
jgi:hypothetical protein